MKYIWFVLPFALGFVGVIQAAVNKNIAKIWGIPAAVFFNTLVLLPIAVVAWWQMGRSFTWQDFRWWFFIPGIFGFILVTFFPIAMMRLGALNVFVGAVAAQMVTSFLWDWKVEGIEFSWLRLSAAGLTIFAAILSRLA